MSTYEAKPGTGTGFAMKREAGDKRPNIELRLKLDRDYRAGDEIKVAGWKKDKLTSTGNVQFSLKIDSGEHQSAGGGGSSRRDDDIPF
jgi:hypothetical protein